MKMLSSKRNIPRAGALTSAVVGAALLAGCGGGGDPLTNAPTPIDAAQLAELGLRILPPPS